jgi:hypothetical protein
MMSESIDYALVKYIKLVEYIMFNDGGVHKLALHIQSLEARNKELELSKTCEGCEYLSPENNDDYEFCTKGKACIRWELDLPDYYKAKETR